MKKLEKDYHIIIKIYLWVAVFIGFFLGFGNIGNLPEASWQPNNLSKNNDYYSNNCAFIGY